MNYQKLLSIIIPTYNMEKYLARCLDSLVNVKEALPMIEILVINDGSKDTSSQIAHEYQERFVGSVVVVDKENGNYGSCVNVGLKTATGKYVKVLDADDWFESRNLVSYLDILASNNTDLILTDFNYVNPKGDVIRTTNFDFPKNTILDIEQFCHLSEFKKMQMHAVTYRAKMLKAINYHQSEGIPYTDQEWIFTPMAYVKSFYYANLVVYQYLIGRNGQTMDETQQRKNISHTLTGMYALLKTYISIETSCCGNMQKYLQAQMMMRMDNLYTRVLLMGQFEMDSIIKLDDFIRKNTNHFYEVSNDIIIHKFLPFHYIKWWRLHDRKRLPKWLVELYCILLSVKRRLNP